MSEQQQGKLPEGFPGRDALADFGITTYAQARKQRDSEQGLREVPHIGDITEAAINEALSAPPAEVNIDDSIAPIEEVPPPAPSGVLAADTPTTTAPAHGFDAPGGVPVAHEHRAEATLADAEFAARAGAPSTESGEPPPPPTVTQGNRSLIIGQAKAKQDLAKEADAEELPVFTKEIMRIVNLRKPGTFTQAEINAAPVHALRDDETLDEAVSSE